MIVNTIILTKVPTEKRGTTTETGRNHNHKMSQKIITIILVIEPIVEIKIYLMMMIVTT